MKLWVLEVTWPNNFDQHHFLALGLSYPKLNSVRSYFRLLWLRCNGNPYTQILAELPYALRADITMKVYGLNIKNVNMYN